jgi:zinc transport system substrate-binding protein
MAIRFEHMEQRGDILSRLSAAVLLGLMVLGLLLSTAAPAAARPPAAAPAATKPPAVAPATAKPPAVVATIRPLAALAAGVMGGIGAPTTLIPPDQVPQTWTLQDKDGNALRQADIVFWIGPSLEAPLSDPFADLEVGARVIELGDTPGLLVYPPRQGPEWEPPPGGSNAADPPPNDGHLWLDSDNVKLLIGRIANTLTDVDFIDAETFRQDAADLRQRVDALDKELALTLNGLRDRPFLELHDDLQYLEARYDLTGAGSIAVAGDPLSAARLAEITAKIQRLHVVCVLGDTASDDAALQAIAAAAKVRVARLDLYGADAGDGVGAYFKTMRAIGAALKQCLGGEGAE